MPSVSGDAEQGGVHEQGRNTALAGRDLRGAATGADQHGI